MPQPRIVVCISRPGTPVEPRRQALEHLLRELGAEQDLAHPDEQRQRGELPATRSSSQNAENRFLPGGVVVKNAWPTQPHDRQRHRDPDAAGEQHQQQRRAAARRSTSDGPSVRRLREKSPRAWRSSTATHVGRLAAAQHDDQLVEHRDEQQDDAERRSSAAGSRSASRPGPGHVVELPALVGEAVRPEREVADRDARRSPARRSRSARCARAATASRAAASRGRSRRA